MALAHPPAAPFPGPKTRAARTGRPEAAFRAVVAIAFLSAGGCAKPPSPPAADDYATALRGGDRAALSRLAASGQIPPNALRRTVQRGCQDLGLLLEAGVDAAKFDGASALAFSLSRDLPECAERLRAAGARLAAWGDPGRHPLTAAAARGDGARIDRLLAIDFPVDAADRHGDNALLLAARSGNIALVGSLLAHGADPEAVDRDGWTALTYAARTGRADLVRELLTAGARPDHASTLGWTALHLAAQARHREAALELLAFGAPPDTVTGTAETALVWAARNGDEELTAALLSAGADPRHELDGVTPAYWARAAGHRALADELERAAEEPRS